MSKRREQLMDDLDENGTFHLSVPLPLTALLLIDVDKCATFSGENRMFVLDASIFPFESFPYTNQTQK